MPVGLGISMRNINILLVTTALISASVATSAVAQVALPAPGPNDGDAALHGTGANAVQNILVRQFNCIGLDQSLGNGAPGQSGSAATKGSLKAIAAAKYTPTAPTATDPALDCSVADTSASSTNIQPAFSAKYVAIASGFGRAAWLQYKDVFDGSTVGGFAHDYNPFNLVSGNARWSHVQFAFSDTPISPADLSGYQNGGSDPTSGNYAGAAASAGPAIQLPLFVLPIAIAYNPQYGVNASGKPLFFNTQYTTSLNGETPVGAIRLTRQLYCSIFNGDITNWNDPAIQLQNGKYVVKINKKNVNVGTPLFDQTNDTATRWSTDGVPIRLIGRYDNAGTTNVFTRHLAAVCGLAGNTVTPNKYLKASEALPYDPTTGINYTSVRSDSDLKPTIDTTLLAGTTNTVSAEYWNDSTKTIAYLGTGPHAAPTGNQGSGLYVLAGTNTAVSNAIAAAPDYALNGVTLNGKIGYLSAEYVPPSPTALTSGVATAILQIGTTPTKFAPPSVTYAQKAFGNAAASTLLLPPESDTTGTYKAGDTRQVYNALGTLENATRANPIAWTDVLYNNPGGNTLAAPADGYPITGTAQFLGYTCYTPSNRQAIVEFLGLALGQIKKNSTGAAVSAKTFAGTTVASLGIFAQSNLSLLPAPWVKAISETFIQNTTAAGGLNLWLQNALAPTPAKGTPGTKSYKAQINTTANSACASLTGA